MATTPRRERFPDLNSAEIARTDDERAVLYDVLWDVWANHQNDNYGPLTHWKPSKREGWVEVDTAKSRKAATIAARLLKRAYRALTPEQQARAGQDYPFRKPSRVR